MPLQAFGNAKTTRNNNSSRFGRYALVQFSADYEVVGAQIRVFLLERSRVTSTANKGERAYHSMYQVVKGGAGKYLADGSPEAYHYLNMSACYDVPDMDDSEDFSEVSKALESVGVSPVEVGHIWSFMAAMLLLGNISFGSSDVASVQDDTPMKKAQARTSSSRAHQPIGWSSGAQQALSSKQQWGCIIDPFMIDKSSCPHPP